MRVIVILILSFLFSSLVQAEENIPSLNEEPIYYELVQDNLKPAQDEFYVNSIYLVKDKAKALIARSTNQRAGDLYQNYVSYGIGDALGHHFIIHDIDIKFKEVIVKDDRTDEYYSLALNYGKATSRLVKRPDYKK